MEKCNASVNQILSNETMYHGRVMRMNWFHFCGTTPDDATESVATHSWRLKTPCMHQCPTLMFGCSGTQIYDPKSWDNIRASWCSVLPRSQTQTSQTRDKRLTARPLNIVSEDGEILFYENLKSILKRDFLQTKMANLSSGGINHPCVDIIGRLARLRRRLSVHHFWR